jgi:hypothetical protein
VPFLAKHFGHHLNHGQFIVNQKNFRHWSRLRDFSAGGQE